MKKKLQLSDVIIFFRCFLLLQIYFNATFYSIIFITNILTSRHIVAIFDIYVKIVVFNQWFVFSVSFLKKLILKLNAKKIARFGFLGLK
ncbi:hypothetical protein UB33_20950 [Photobacterium angustum]|uniref:hypothetical protein n=1 Tax=Photobacterium angustum TaxID=661 RepID=UPI0005E1EDCB|nr:hypothetical protein [Photobacterium angustum]KJF92370.1 hypothetical protein UB39_21075 [Photobacterium angustum]KJG04043.1 hypothetical protein UB33_20950 [Photobacterium angustum]PSV94084.1 hypothetical protein CTN01_08800 [Photobacterium angustum]PSW78640.1 hypothetical protein CTN03_18350 [Photobacterium angustum]